MWPFFCQNGEVSRYGRRRLLSLLREHFYHCKCPLLFHQWLLGRSEQLRLRNVGQSAGPMGPQEMEDEAMTDQNHVKKLQQGPGEWNVWRQRNPDSQPDLSGASLEQADLVRVNLAGADLVRADLTGANALEACLSGADLVRANLTGATLVKTILAGANLFEANLTEADLVRANLARATLVKANLTGAVLMGANLEGADLTGAILVRVNLMGANLKGADLARADLTDANLIGCNLEGAILEGTNLAEVEVEEADQDEDEALPEKEKRYVVPAFTGSGDRTDASRFFGTTVSSAPLTTPRYNETEKR